VVNPVHEVSVQNEIDPRPNIENVEVAVDEQTEKVVASLNNFGEYMKSAGYGLQKVIKAIGTTVFSVEVKNPTTEVTVTNLSDIKQPTIPRTVRISNSTPSEAIPVVLTTHDRKRFYEVLTTISDAGAKANIEIGDINANLDTLEHLQGSALMEAYGEESDVPPATETELASFVVPAGTYVLVKGIDATGDRDARFLLYTNGTKKAEWRTNWCSRNIVSGIEARASAGQTISLRVVNVHGGLGTFGGHMHIYVVSL